jgi:hypothetical protein
MGLVARRALNAVKLQLRMPGFVWQPHLAQASLQCILLVLLDPSSQARPMLPWIVPPKLG